MHWRSPVAACGSSSAGSGAGSEPKQLWRTTDAAHSWQGPQTLETMGYADQVSAVDTTTAWRYGGRGNLLHTNDGGHTWQTVALPEQPHS